MGAFDDGVILKQRFTLPGRCGVLACRLLPDIGLPQIQAMLAEEFAQAGEGVFHGLADVGFGAGEMCLELVAVEFQADFERAHVLRV